MDISNDVLAQFAGLHGRHYVQYTFVPQNVLSGEAHGEAYDMDAQAAFIKTFRPAVVLHEFVGIDIYDPLSKSWSKRRKEIDRTAEYEEDARKEIVEAFKGLADEYNFLLVGCDLTLSERAYLINERGGKYQSDEAIRSKKQQMGQQSNGLVGVKYLDLADPERHKEMAAVYQQYRDRGVLMITGLHHVRGDNPPDWQRSDLHDLITPADYGVLEHRLDMEMANRMPVTV